MPGFSAFYLFFGIRDIAVLFDEKLLRYHVLVCNNYQVTSIRARAFIFPYALYVSLADH